MGVGYNLGNSLEAASSGTPNETAYGNPKLTEDLVLAAKDAGFKSIRIPVSYLSMIDDNNGYKIDSSWLLIIALTMICMQLSTCMETVIRQ